MLEIHFFSTTPFFTDIFHYNKQEFHIEFIEFPNVLNFVMLFKCKKHKKWDKPVFMLFSTYLLCSDEMQNL